MLLYRTIHSIINRSPKELGEFLVFSHFFFDRHEKCIYVGTIIIFFLVKMSVLTLKKKFNTR